MNKSQPDFFVVVLYCGKFWQKNEDGIAYLFFEYGILSNEYDDDESESQTINGPYRYTGILK
jgi:hypothetical protein